jgi:hypothetical protein
MKTRKFGGGGYAAGLEGHIRRGSAKQAREERIKEDKKDAIEPVAPELLLAGAPRMGAKALAKVTDKALSAYQRKLLQGPMTTKKVGDVSYRSAPGKVARSPRQAGKYREGPELQSPEELKTAQAAARAAKKRGAKAVKSPEYQAAVKGPKRKITVGEEFKIREGYKRGGYMKKKESKEGTVMGEFKRGSLKSSSGKKVTNRKQAVAIALSEAGKSKRKK